MKKDDEYEWEIGRFVRFTKKLMVAMLLFYGLIFLAIAWLIYYGINKLAG